MHLHILFLDGAFEGGPRGRPVFRPGPRVTDDDVGALVAAIAERVEALLPLCDETADEDEPLALFQAASLQDLGSRTAVCSARSSAPSASVVRSARSRRYAPRSMGSTCMGA